MAETKLEYYAPGVVKKSRGLGDTIEKITKATGIKAVVDFVADALDVDCGCQQRKEKLNNILPYKQ